MMCNTWYDVPEHRLRPLHYDNGTDRDYNAVRTQIPITPTRALTFYKA